MLDAVEHSERTLSWVVVQSVDKFLDIDKLGQHDRKGESHEIFEGQCLFEDLDADDKTYILMIW